MENNLCDVSCGSHAYAASLVILQLASDISSYSEKIMVLKKHRFFFIEGCLNEDDSI